MNVLLSLGSAVKIGYKKGAPIHNQKTCYLMMEGKCNAGCLYCIRSKEDNKLSRIPWYSYNLEETIPKIESNFQRVCIQSVNHNNFLFEIKEIISKFSDSIPISVSLSLKQYTGIENLYGYVDKIGIGLDCVRKDIFQKLKPYYDWNKTWDGLNKATEIFGDYNVICHLICGLGEKEEEIINMIHRLYDMRIYPSLFSFTPVNKDYCIGMESPDVSSYRRIQIAHYLITSKNKNYGDMEFERGRVILDDEDISNLKEEIFITKGCPSCDRPFYNESPRGTIYNYPSIESVNLSKMKEEIIKD